VDRRWVVRSLIALALVAGTWLVVRQMTREEPLEVATVALERGTVRSSVVNTRAGAVRARSSASIGPEIAGEVAQLAVRRGSVVRSGELLLALDTSVLEAQLELARRERDVLEAQSRRACVARERAERALRRHRALAERGDVSADELDRIESEASVRACECEIASAELARADARIALALVELERAWVRAPFDGIVAETTVEVGERVVPLIGSAVTSGTVELYDPRTIHVVAPMDEVDSARLRVGAVALVTIDSHPGRVFEGRLCAVAPYVLDVEQQNRTVEIEVELAPDDTRTLLPGTSADVEIVLESHAGVPRLPTSTLQPGGRVLVVVDDRLEVREVERGLANWEWTEVRGGLADSDRIVVPRGEAGLEAGRLVRGVAKDAP
jgi:HlyD family secretion protein